MAPRGTRRWAAAGGVVTAVMLLVASVAGASDVDGGSGDDPAAAVEGDPAPGPAHPGVELTSADLASMTVAELAQLTDEQLDLLADVPLDQWTDAESDTVRARNLGVEWDDEDGYGFDDQPPMPVPGQPEGPLTIHVELTMDDD